MPDVFGPSTIAISQGIGAFQFLLPRLSEVRKADAANNPDMVGDVRLGEVAAFTLTVGVGVIASSLAGTPVPAYVALLTGVVMICIYETALRGNKPGNPVSPVARSDDA